MTKYAVMIKDVKTVRYHVEKAIYLATTGRRGPCWIDVPLDIQGAIIDTDDQEKFEIPHIETASYSMDRVVRTLNNSKRPVILVGSGIRTSGAYEKFLEFVEKCKIPVLAATSNADLLNTEHKYYFGNFGVFGGRAGNFIIQNSDCLLVLGCRLAFKHIGFDYDLFASKAKKIVIDVDVNELKKSTMKIDIPICASLDSFLGDILEENLNFDLDVRWLDYCNILKQKYPIYSDKFSVSDNVNPYFFFDKMKYKIDDNATVVVGNSCACVCLLQTGVLKSTQRLWGNVNCGTMGYDLPAAIGAAVATKQGVICVTGDGSIQMNIQELQTIITNNLPVKIIIFNNNGYHAIVQSQKNFFGRLSGCTKESGISFPNFEKIAEAYGYPYMICTNHSMVDERLDTFLSLDGYGILEIIEDSNQPIEPKQKSKALSDGTIISPPISDLAPFLDENEYKIYSDFECGEWIEIYE